jgi:D-alanine-D-alanine ligase
MKKLKITVLYDVAEEDYRKEEEAKGGKEITLVSEDVSHILSGLGHEVKTLAAAREIRKLAAQIDLNDSDLIFNLCESLGGVSQAEPTVAALLEVFGKRFTGAGSIGLTLAQDKELSKKIFHFHGIRYPKFSSMDAGKVEWADELSFPLFVKPLNEDASIGIDSGSIVNSIKELMERISYIHTEFKAAALVEEYIEGREIYIGILGTDKPEAMPILEWDFSKMPDGFPRIASTEAKWDATSVYQHAPEVFPMDIPEPVYTQIQAAAVQAYKSLKLRDYGRVDMRLRHIPSKNRQSPPRASHEDREWQYYVIEVNPNPYLGVKDELAVAARKQGLEYPRFIEKIVELAMERHA